MGYDFKDALTAGLGAATVYYAGRLIGVPDLPAIFVAGAAGKPAGDGVVYVSGKFIDWIEQRRRRG